MAKWRKVGPHSPKDWFEDSFYQLFGFVLPCHTYPSIHFPYLLIQHRVAWRLEPIPGNSPNTGCQPAGHHHTCDGQFGNANRCIRLYVGCFQHCRLHVHQAGVISIWTRHGFVYLFIVLSCGFGSHPSYCNRNRCSCCRWVEIYLFKLLSAGPTTDLQCKVALWHSIAG